MADRMVELTRSPDPVFMSWLRARLAEDGIFALIFDHHTSAAYGGALDTVVARVMVAEEDIARARLILAESPSPDGDG